MEPLRGEEPFVKFSFSVNRVLATALLKGGTGLVLPKQVGPPELPGNEHA
jgi:hypothetical protein